jgi:hypothetical protein
MAETAESQALVRPAELGRQLRDDALGRLDPAGGALADFDVTVTFCFPPEHLGLAPHHGSAPIDPLQFADFCARMIERYPPAPLKAAVA